VGEGDGSALCEVAGVDRREPLERDDLHDPIAIEIGEGWRGGGVEGML
jgi:hypothetical protein